MPKKTSRSRVPPLRVPLTDAQRRALANHVGPSEESLREIPEVDFDRAAVVGRGDEGQRQVLEYLRARRGRPKKGEERNPAVTRTLRLTEATWKALERRAAQQRTTVHALLREAVEELLRKVG